MTNEQIKQILRLKYVGCGWFRDSSVPIGKKATIIHGPVLLELLKLLVKND